MGSKKALIKSSVLTNPKKVAKLIAKNKVSNAMTDEIEIVVEHKFLGLKSRSMGAWKWDYAYRPNGQNPVHIIAKEKKTKKYLLILQPRAPINGKNLVLSFPAGLIDKGETAKEAAIREMIEETGFTPENVISYKKQFPKSAGLTNESAFVVECDVNGKNKNKPKLEPDEDIYSLWMSIEEFWESYPKMAENIVIEYDLFMFMLGKRV